MTDHVETYLEELKKALQGSDAAVIHDALADAEEHLRNAMEGAREEKPDMSESDAIDQIIEEYGSPEEIASAYREIEKHLAPALAPTRSAPNSSVWARFFGVIADPQAWGALLYMLISLLTGILYFTWAVTGLSLSVGLIILIIGLPVIALFMLSVRGIALVEGRIVEALLGVRMPRKPIFLDPNKTWWQRWKMLFFSLHTWKTILYMILMLPLGILYFTVVVTLISIGLSLIAAPVVQLFFNYPIITINSLHYYLPFWSSFLFMIGGALVVLLTMHLAKLTGRLQGGFARWMLVND